MVSQVKLIAEPWDVGEGGYQVGNFPPLWTEWNGKYRDTVRDFWRGEPRRSREFASRLTGSRDLYQDDGRRPHRLASTSSPRTTASRCATSSPTTRSTTRPTARATATARATTAPGTAASRAPTDDPRPCSRCAPASSATSSPRCCCRRACRCSLHGDEMGRTQRGNNNVYCQDNEMSWVDWAPDEADARAARRSPQRLVALRRDHPVFRRRRFFQGAAVRGRHERARRHRLVHARPATQMQRRRLARRLRPVASRCSSTASAIAEPDTRGQHDRSTTRSC